MIFDKFRFKRFILISLICAGIFFVGMFFLIKSQSVKDSTAFNEDCVLVLGFGLKGDKIRPALQYRLDKCIDYLQQNPKAKVIVSGGQGRGETICESTAMKNYLVSKGVDSEKIIEENRSKNTRQNMLYSKIILDTIFPLGNYSVACITTDFHSYRANKLSKKAGFSVSHYNAKTDWYSYPVCYFREVLSIVKMWIGF